MTQTLIFVPQREGKEVPIELASRKKNGLALLEGFMDHPLTHPYSKNTQTQIIPNPKLRQFSHLTYLEGGWRKDGCGGTKKGKATF